MRTVAADLILLGILIFDGVSRSLLGLGGMERGIEDENLGNLRHNGGTAVDTHQMCRGMQGCKVNAHTKLFHDLGGDQAGLKEVGTAVDDAVTDSLDLLHILDAAVLRIGQRIDEDLGSNGVVGHVHCKLNLSAVGKLMRDLAVKSNTLADTLCKDISRFHIKELVLQRGAACVYNENFHNNFPPMLIFLLQKVIL